MRMQNITPLENNVTITIENTHAVYIHFTFIKMPHSSTVKIIKRYMHKAMPYSSPYNEKPGTT